MEQVSLRETSAPPSTCRRTESNAGARSTCAAAREFIAGLQTSMFTALSASTTMLIRQHSFPRPCRSASCYCHLLRLHGWHEGRCARVCSFAPTPSTRCRCLPCGCLGPHRCSSADWVISAPSACPSPLLRTLSSRLVCFLRSCAAVWICRCTLPDARLPSK
jgi:hypothetical protein